MSKPVGKPVSKPSLSLMQQLADFGDEAGPQIVERLREIIDSGGTKRIEHRCTACGQKDTITLTLYDAQELIKVASELRLMGAELAKQQAQRGGDDTSKRAGAILREISEMSSKEIAEEIARLDADA